MARWEEVVAAEPELSARVRRCFGIRKHATLATLRRDGSPRISSAEVDFDDDGGLYLGMMPGSLKALDLRRDPRLALHCPTDDAPDDDPGSWLGDAKIAGRGVEVSDATRTEVVLTTVGDPPDHLVIRSWHPGQGLRQRHRR